MTFFIIACTALVVCVSANLYLALRASTGSVRVSLAAAQLLILVVGLTSAMALPFYSMVEYYWQLWSLIASLVGSLMVSAVMVFRVLWKNPSALRTTLIRGTLSLFALCFAVLALELFFKQFFVQSDGFLLTYAGRNWVRDNWKPINSLGYRDVEPAHRAIGDREKILVVGDSFVAGAGIEDSRDRFGELLAAALGERAVVFTAAGPGWSTLDEAEAISSYPIRPDRIVLSYYVNDIEAAAAGIGQPTPEIHRSISRVMAPLVDYSFFVNFAYWRAYRLFNDEIGTGYWRHLVHCYGDDHVWAAHQRELERLLMACGDAELLVVIFPFLPDVAGSTPMTSRVHGFFESQRVEVLDLTPVFEGRNWRDLVVNPHDSHPNEAVHAEVAALIVSRIIGGTALQIDGGAIAAPSPPAEPE